MSASLRVFVAVCLVVGGIGIAVGIGVLAANPAAGPAGSATTSASTTKARRPVTPSVTSTPTADPTATPRPEPDDADAAALRFVDATNVAYQTQDVRGLVAISAPSCRVCVGIADDIRAVTGPGYRWSGGLIHLRAHHPLNMTVGEPVPVAPNESGGVRIALSGTLLDGVTVEDQHAANVLWRNVYGAPYPLKHRPEAGQTVVVVDVSIDALTVIDPNGKRDPYSGPALPVAQLVLTLARRDGKWLCYEMLMGTPS